jgi:uncharacterized protein
MKKIYIIHGWGGCDSDEGWFGWLKEEGKKLGFDVICFNMPNTEKPTIEEWVGFLEDNISDTDEETYFVGHSIGCQTIIRFLEKMPKDKKIGGAVFVAGWFNLKDKIYEEEGDETKIIAKPWVETPIDFNKVKLHTDNFLAIFSDNDPFVSLSEENLFKENLEAKTVVKEKEGHFNESEKIEEILSAIKS